MIKRISTFVILLIAPIALIGCGGSDSTMDPTPPPPHLAAEIAWPVVAEYVRTIHGLDEPGFTTDEAYADQKRIIQNGNSVLYSDVFLAPVDARPTRVQVDCEPGAGTCSLAMPTGNVALSIADLPGANPDYKTKYRSQEIGELGGIRFEQTVGKDEAIGFDVDVRAGGGWMSHSGFAVRGALVPDTGLWIPGAVSAGSATGSNPVSGSATWDGMMVGLNLRSPTGNPVAGNARIAVEFGTADPTVDVGFTNIKDLRDGQAHPDISWSGLELSAGGFRDGGDGASIQGQFYGPNAEEVGGVFERNYLLGAFGAKR